MECPPKQGKRHPLKYAKIDHHATRKPPELPKRCLTPFICPPFICPISTQKLIGFGDQTNLKVIADSGPSFCVSSSN